MRTPDEQEQLIRSCENLAWKMALKLHSVRADLRKDDLYALALDGLAMAAKMWDPAKGAYTTVAVRAIKWKFCRVFQSERRFREKNVTLLSIDAKFNENADSKAFSDYLEAPGLSPEEAAVQRDEIRRMLSAVEKLPDAQKNAVKLYYGIGCREHNTNEIAARYGYSREAANQAIQRGIKNLRKALAG